MKTIPKRKYRGALRLAPLRAAALEAIRRYDEDDADDPRVLAEEMRKAGFVKPARLLRDVLDAHQGTIRCKACDEPLGAGGPSTGPYSRERCDVCTEHRRRRTVLAYYGKRKARRILDPRVPRGSMRTEDKSRWPWIRRNDGTYVIQKSWRHLGGRIPTYEAYFKMTTEQQLAVDLIIREERTKRGVRW